MSPLICRLFACLSEDARSILQFSEKEFLSLFLDNENRGNPQILGGWGDGGD